MEIAVVAGHIVQCLHFGPENNNTLPLGTRYTPGGDIANGENSWYNRITASWWCPPELCTTGMEIHQIFDTKFQVIQCEGDQVRLVNPNKDERDITFLTHVAALRPIMEQEGIYYNSVIWGREKLIDLTTPEEQVIPIPAILPLAYTFLLEPGDYYDCCHSPSARASDWDFCGQVTASPVCAFGGWEGGDGCTILSEDRSSDYTYVPEGKVGICPRGSDPRITAEDPTPYLQDFVFACHNFRQSLGCEWWSTICEGPLSNARRDGTFEPQALTPMLSPGGGFFSRYSTRPVQIPPNITGSPDGWPTWSVKANSTFLGCISDNGAATEIVVDGKRNDLSTEGVTSYGTYQELLFNAQGYIFLGQQLSVWNPNQLGVAGLYYVTYFGEFSVACPPNASFVAYGRSFDAAFEMEGEERQLQGFFAYHKNASVEEQQVRDDNSGDVVEPQMHYGIPRGNCKMRGPKPLLEFSAVSGGCSPHVMWMGTVLLSALLMHWS